MHPWIWRDSSREILIQMNPMIPIKRVTTLALPLPSESTGEVQQSFLAVLFFCLLSCICSDSCLIYIVQSNSEIDSKKKTSLTQYYSKRNEPYRQGCQTSESGLVPRPPPSSHCLHAVWKSRESLVSFLTWAWQKATKIQNEKLSFVYSSTVLSPSVPMFN